MNSISSVPLPGNCRIVLYADDVLLFEPIDSESDLSDFQTDLENIISWMTQQGLTPNCDKTHLLPISRSRARLPPLTLMINGHIFSPCTSVKYLGVTLSNNLTWGTHIDNVCNSTKQQIGCIHRQLRYAPPQLRRKIYITTTLPKLECCSAVWDPHHVKRRQQLENVQKFAGRVITNNWTSGYESLSLGFMKLADRRRTQKLKLLQNCEQSFLYSLFHSPSSPSPLSSSSKLKTTLPSSCED